MSPTTDIQCSPCSSLNLSTACLAMPGSSSFLNFPMHSLATSIAKLNISWGISTLITITSSGLYFNGFFDILLIWEENAFPFGAMVGYIQNDKIIICEEWMTVLDL